MNTDKFTWKGYEWQTKERWGYQHPDKPWAFYSQHCVDIDRDDNLILSISDSLTNYDKTKIFPMGLVSTTQANPLFKYGIYKFTAKLPRGKNLWPALWMYSWDEWPPELDVMEAWTNKCGNYLMKNIKDMCITTAYHYDKNDQHESEYLKLKDCLFKLPQYNFNDYIMEWTPDYIVFYFNKKVIWEITNKDNLKWISEHSKNGMNVIMNIYPTQNYKDGDMKTPLIIKDFEYIS